MESQTQPNFPCRFCDRLFKRLEHAQRHERTHTKETPYKCPCGKAFPRGDLLRRHEKSAHNIDTSRRGRRAALKAGALNRAASEVLDGDHLRLGGASADSLSQSPRDSRTLSLPHAFQQTLSAPNALGNGHVNGTSSPLDSTVFDNHVVGSLSEELPQTYLPHTNTHEGQQQNIPTPQGSLGSGFSGFNIPSVDPFELFGDGNTLFDNLDLSSFFLSQDLGIEPALSAQLYPSVDEQRGPDVLQSPRQLKLTQPTTGVAEQNSISRFGSPLPSIRPEHHGSSGSTNERQSGHTRSAPCWKLSNAEYNGIQQGLSHLASALPRDFALPSKHTLSRYLEGCIKGLYEHMPHLHIPTFSASTSPPDLLLSMAAIGAQFRFEGHMAVTLFYAAKAAVIHQLYMNKDEKVIEELSQPPNVHHASTTMSPRSARDSQSFGVQHGRHEINGRDSRLKTMQAIIILMVLGSWGPQQLVSEAIGFQSLLAELVREDGLGPDEDGEDESSNGENLSARWHRWIQIESRRRTKLMAYTFLNLQSVAYNVAPSLLTSEIQFKMPGSLNEWNAKTPSSWDQARQTSKIPPTTFTESFRSLFRASESGTTTPPPPSSAIGNYALIFAILQCIFLLREGCTTLPTEQESSNLRPEDIDSLGRALQNWQSRWEGSPESTIEPSSSSGPVAFNSTALLRLAWIRLHSDLGPCRSLASRNAVLIVEAFKNSPPLHRHPGLTPALLHAAHALSVPVRLGINYVAKTQTLSWSVQHSLCNLECAIFLSKWFDAVASTATTTPLTSQEKGLISMIRSIIRETGFFRDEAFELGPGENGWRRLMQHLGTAVATLWAEIFSGTHIFDMVSTIGTSLNIYAKLLEDAHTPINGM